MLDEDGEETEYAVYTMEDLVHQGVVLRAQLGSMNAALPDPDKEAAGKD